MSCDSSFMTVYGKVPPELPLALASHHVVLNNRLGAPSSNTWTHLRVDFDGGDVGLLVDVFDVGFMDVAIVHLDLWREPG